MIARVTKFISRELARPLALSDLARAGGVSNQHLLKLFRDRKMETPTRLLYAKRLEAARDWLAHTGLSIGEISTGAGLPMRSISRGSSVKPTASVPAPGA